MLLVVIRENRAALDARRIHLLRIDLQVLEGLLDHLGLDLLFAQQPRQRRRGDVTRVDLEEIAERGAVFAAAEAIRAQRDHRTANPSRHHVRLALQIVRRRYDDAGRAGQA